MLSYRIVKDLRINLYLATEDGSFAPEGPGWYLTAAETIRQDSTTEVREIIPHVRIPGTEMERLGQVLDNFAKGKPQNWTTSHGYTRLDVSLREAIRQANIVARDEINRRIEYLKSAQQQLEMLAARAEEFDLEKES